MLQKLLTLILVLGIVSSASATNPWWYGTVDTDIYNHDNYDRALNPGEPDSTTGLNWSVSNLGLHTDGETYRMFSVVNDDIGTQSYWSYCEWAKSDYLYESRVEVVNGSTTNYTVNAGLTIGTIGYGQTTWYMEDADCLGWTLAVVGRTIGVVNPGADSCRLQMRGDSLFDVGYFWVGRNTNGRAEIYDNSVLSVDNSSYWALSFGADQITYDDGWGLIDIRDNGKIVWDGDHTVMGDDQVQVLVDAGVLVAYDGGGTVNWSYDFMNDETIITGIPEPATIALLGLGGLLLMRRKH